MHVAVSERRNLSCVNGPYIHNTDVVRNRAWLHNTKKENNLHLNHEKILKSKISGENHTIVNTKLLNISLSIN